MARRVARRDLDFGGDRALRSEAGRALRRRAARAAGDEEVPEVEGTERGARSAAGPGARSAAGRDEDVSTESSLQEAGVLNLTPEESRERLRRRARFLRELAEARELRERVTPHRARRKQIHAALRRRTFRFLG
ncbi:hypothetical protein [Actinomadura gamaensis]|uniref:Uncharacterized protein n=1 Tax=Actinomadura gamaensis TaxID=1763541 RepID=A0ABV9TXF3_9ACTN